MKSGPFGLMVHWISPGPAPQRGERIADPDKAVVKAYDLDGPLGFGVRRGTYLIGRDGRIVDSVLADLRIGAHEAFVRSALKSGAKN